MTDDNQLSFNVPSVSIFGLSGKCARPPGRSRPEDIRVRPAVNHAEVLRGLAEARYAAKT
jgi:hypothetical protein